MPLQTLDKAMEDMIRKFFEGCGTCPNCGGMLTRPKVLSKVTGEKMAGACIACGYKQPPTEGEARKKMTPAEMTLKAHRVTVSNFYTTRSIFGSDTVMAKTFDNFNVTTKQQKELMAYGVQIVNQLVRGDVVHGYLGGNTGVGKTHLANGIALAYMEESYWTRKALFVDWREFLDQMKDGFGDDRRDVRERVADTMKEFQRADLVILDDFGSERDTQSKFSRDIADRFWRTREDKSVIMTSNLLVSEIHKRYGDRTYSRIAKFSQGNGMAVSEAVKDYRRGA
ncbi:ATP-binding protein [Lacticaseibacillus baoqingensis]|uniref:ATP-binding protein n=1 Tax=Lacticaseibacillus baoqingensis TaxID=2486013 RepID=A0ABW4E7M0_9LACO|nr:ATP-binding protein [Lacticaseibacillus baoqingensis]